VHQKLTQAAKALHVQLLWDDKLWKKVCGQVEPLIESEDKAPRHFSYEQLQWDDNPWKKGWWTGGAPHRK
jgi:hypothetical protein